jgi:hypothetical protein
VGGCAVVSVGWYTGWYTGPTSNVGERHVGPRWRHTVLQALVLDEGHTHTHARTHARTNDEHMNKEWAEGAVVIECEARGLRQQYAVTRGVKRCTTHRHTHTRTHTHTHTRTHSHTHAHAHTHTHARTHTWLGVRKKRGSERGSSPRPVAPRAKVAKPICRVNPHAPHPFGRVNCRKQHAARAAT